MKPLPLLLLLAVSALAQSPALEYPLIQGHGGVFRLAGAEAPVEGSRLVLDVTTADSTGKVNKGFALAARYVNLFALYEIQDAKVAVVLHGGATKESLDDAQYKERFGKANPNRELLQQLRKAGVDVVVCGQSVVHNGFAPEALAPEVGLAASAATALTTRQKEGYSYLPIR